MLPYFFGAGVVASYGLTSIITLSVSDIFSTIEHVGVLWAFPRLELRTWYLVWSGTGIDNCIHHICSVFHIHGYWFGAGQFHVPFHGLSVTACMMSTLSQLMMERKFQNDLYGMEKGRKFC